MGLEGLVVANGIDEHEAGLVGIADVLRHGELEGEGAVLHAVATSIDGVGTFLEGEGHIERGVVATTGDGLFLVANGQGGQSFELGTISSSLSCPYQAKVMKTLETISNRMV